ncbi:hypothetical protein E150_03525 [Chlamydia trachomatis E/150]|nr:hypothetical protein E150_03525 [Chlamydia trachomatis E/150]AGR95950.1 hypothetical protein CTRC852_03575 [Chlamydia trachomatis RC-F(s)/852]
MPGKCVLGDVFRNQKNESFVPDFFSKILLCFKLKGMKEKTEKAPLSR